MGFFSLLYCQLNIAVSACLERSDIIVTFFATSVCSSMTDPPNYVPKTSRWPTQKVNDNPVVYSYPSLADNFSSVTLIYSPRYDFRQRSIQNCIFNSCLLLSTYRKG